MTPQQVAALLAIIVTSIGGVVYYDIALNNPSETVENNRIKAYILHSLAEGCRPIVDACTENCGTPDLSQYGECADIGFIRADPKRVQQVYLDIADDKNVGHSTVKELREMPDKLRDKIQEEGGNVKAKKQDLSGDPRKDPKGTKNLTLPE